LSQIGVFIWAWPDGPKEMQTLWLLSRPVFPDGTLYAARRTVDAVEKQRLAWHTALPFATDGIVVRSDEPRVKAGYRAKATGSLRGNIRLLRRLLR
jgi:DNA ligase (NAD+)